MKLRVFAGTLVMLLTPFFASAQIGGVTNETTDVDSFLIKVEGWINTLLPIVVAIALLYFLYGLLKYVMSGGDEAKRAEARNVMLWGIIALFVMVSIWGLVAFLANSLGISQGGSVESGEIPGVGLGS